MGQSEEAKKRRNQIVVGINFGLCGITFAYGFLDDPNKEVKLGKFESQDINYQV